MRRYYRNPYETGAGYLRPVSRTLATGASSAVAYTYYGDAEAAIAMPTTPPVPPACSTTAPGQAKALKSTTGATPAAGGALVRQFVYDATGRVIRSSLAGNWTCTVYDARGRITAVAVPAYGTEPAHTLAYAYAVGDNPLVATVTDTVTVPTTVTTTITATVDLLGRVVSYTDVWNKTTTSTYDQADRRTDTAGPAGPMHVDYSPAGRVVAQRLDNVTMASAPLATAYVNGELATVSYPSGLGNGGNGTSLSAITRHGTGLTTGLTWTATSPSATIATDAVVRSQSGRVVDETIDGTDAEPDPTKPNFKYDAVGRLVQARAAIAGATHVLDYAFDTSGGCGPQTAPGRNSNRSSVTDTVTGTPTTIGYCYDNADRLVSSTDAAVGTPAYDSHGNTTTLGTQTLIYDGAGRHMETKVAGTTLVRYERDATGRITSRREGTAPAVHYGFTGPGDSPSFVMDDANNVIERTVGLLGGAMVTKRGGLAGVGDVWSYPNVHGDVIAVADHAGAKQGATRTYDPFGQGAPPDNSAGNFDYGWLGQHQRPSEHAGSVATIEMGARQYVPSIGRFLQVDPVEGGSCNDYDYVCGDPVNGRDLGGLRGTKALPDRDAECLGGNYEQVSTTICRGYQQAKVTGDSDFYYKSKTFSDPGRQNAAGKYLADKLRPVFVDNFADTAAICGKGAAKGAVITAVAGGEFVPPLIAGGAIVGCGTDVGVQVAKGFNGFAGDVANAISDATDAGRFIRGVGRAL